MAKQQVTVPDIGGAEGAEVIELLVAVGDRIEMEQSLIVLESDKASMEIPSTAEGTLVELLVSEGQELAEGAVIAVIEVSASDGAESVAETPAAAPDPAADEPVVQPDALESAPVAVAPAAASGGAPANETGAPANETGAPTNETIAVPDIGTDEAVDLIEICVKPGDTIAEGDSLVVLESDKASMEVPAPGAGEVVEILVNEGDSVRQGDNLLVMRVAQASTASKAPEAAAAPPTSAPAAPAAVPSPAPAPKTAQAAPAATSAGVYAGPAVRKLAREFGIDLAVVTGTGPRGRLLKEDLHQFVQKSLSGQAPAATGGAGLPVIPEVDFAKFGEVEVTQRSKLDKLTATNMQRSWLNVPHVTQFDDADITELEEFRAGLKAEAERRGTRLTPMPFLLKACAVALRDNPKLNSSLAQAGEQLVYKKYIHIGMAVDTPAGLMVPVLRDVDKKTIWELAEEVLSLAGKARDRKLMPAEMQGGCFTISSLGNIGGTGFTPIVNAPELGILGVSNAAIKPQWDGETFQPRKMLPLALSYDHRVVNGGDGGRFLSRIVSLLGDIRQLVM